MSHLRRTAFPGLVTSPTIATTDTSSKTLTEEFDLSYGTPIRIEILMSAQSGTGTLTFELFTGTCQTAAGVRVYQTSKTKTHDNATAGTLCVLTLQPEVAGDQGFLPTGMFGLLKAKSDGTATCTVLHVAVLQGR